LSDGTARTLRVSDFLNEDIAIPGEWLVGGVAADFSVRATASVFNMGPDGFFNGTLDTWESLSSTREWQVDVNTQNSQAEARADLLIEIAYTTDLTTVIGSAIIYLIAEAFTAQ
jgi:hypothetical protein